MNKTTRFELPEVVPTGSRFRNPIGKYRLNRTEACTACGKCVEVCPYGVHVMRRGEVLVEHAYRCVGPDCPEPCHRVCPEQALSLKRNPDLETMGDFRWTPDLLASTWYMAGFGTVPPAGLEYRTGASGGGFDKLRIIVRGAKGRQASTVDPSDDDVDVGVDLNRRNDHAHRVEIQVPFYGGGMSYGSVCITTMLSRIKAATALGTFCCTGRRGVPGRAQALRRSRHHPGGDGSFRRAGRDHPEGQDRGVQVRPGRKAGARAGTCSATR